MTNEERSRQVRIADSMTRMFSAAFCVVGTLTVLVQWFYFHGNTEPVTVATVSHAVDSLVGAGMLFTGMIIGAIANASDKSICKE